MGIDFAERFALRSDCFLSSARHLMTEAEHSWPNTYHYYVMRRENSNINVFVRRNFVIESEEERKRRA